jgi:hypothetical protein
MMQTTFISVSLPRGGKRDQLQAVTNLMAESNGLMSEGSWIMVGPAQMVGNLLVQQFYRIVAEGPLDEEE